MADYYKWVEKKPQEKFINPYSFVSLGSDVVRTEQKEGTLTGKIKVSLIVKTPLAIPDTENVSTDNIGHKTFSFFRVGNDPTIPGSQLRGMLRSAYETLSNSCFSVNNNNILTARHANPGNPGIIKYEQGAWHLYDARTSKDHGQEIDINTSVRRTWYTINGNKLKTKIFSSTGKGIECVNIDKAIDNYNEVVKLYDEQTTGDKSFSKKKPHLTYGVRKDGKLYPIFYEIVEHEGEKYVYFSPAQLGRYVFDNRLDNLLGTHASCSKQDGTGLCKACALFGMISSNNKKGSYASKLRFSDARAVRFDTLGYSTLKELSGPKTTSVEFYSKRPTIGDSQAKYWTYDYAVTGYRKQNRQYIPQKTMCSVVIRGRKYYWHNPRAESDRTVYSIDEKTKRNCTSELCKPESRFVFDIFFERITEQQLKELLWTITIGENEESSSQMYKLGHGKPLGLGSVKLVIEEVQIRTFNTESLVYKIDTIDHNKVTQMLCSVPFDLNDIADKKAFDEFMRLTQFDALSGVTKNGKIPICYPIADDGENKKNSKASHQWFIANRSMGEGGTTTAWSVKYTLPACTNKTPALKALKRELENKSERFNMINIPGYK